MHSSKVEICGVNTSKLPVLKGEEKRTLFERILQGDEEAREQYIFGNLRLVLSIIQRFNNRGEYVDDIFQVGCIGLIKAIDNFDITQGVQFSTYAVPMIIGEIRRYLRDNNTIRVSRSLRDTAYKALSVKERLTAKNSKEPDIEEIAKELELPKEDVIFALDAIQDPVSLFEPVYNDGADAIFVMDQVSDEKNTDIRWLENLSLSEALKRLGDREKNILSLRFFEGKTQMEVADEIGISHNKMQYIFPRHKDAYKGINSFTCTTETFFYFSPKCDMI
jgi:RNA polymerase sporulation-specific sigma factor